MLPRPRLFFFSGTWAEADRPRLRCTWQMQPRPGWHVPVFCNDLNLFYSIHFPLFCLFLCGFGWELCRTATKHSALCHCNQDGAGNQTIKAPSMPCWGAAGPWKRSLFMPQDWWNWEIKLVKSVSTGSFQYKNQMNGDVSNLTVFQPRIYTDSSWN